MSFELFDKEGEILGMTIFTGLLEDGGHFDSVEEDMREWALSHREYRVLGVNQSQSSGVSEDGIPFTRLIITVFHGGPDETR